MIFDGVVKERVFWVFRFTVGDGEKVEKWYFFEWEGGRILLYLGCLECRKDIFEEIFI